MKLEDIGFYTLSDYRAKNVSINSPIMRGELILTDKCNLRCPYCRGLKSELRGELSLPHAQEVLQNWVNEGIVNVRLSGGEPTQYPFLKTLVYRCKRMGVKRIAISTNGTADICLYKELLKLGVNDFSVSLDSGCCSIGDKMMGGSSGMWNKAVSAIKYLSKKTYITVGVVFNELNVDKALETIKFADSLRVSDIRVISSVQYNQAINSLDELSDEILNKYPILKYRVSNFRQGKSMRGIKITDCHKCHLVLDDIAVAGKYHFPCIIYLREGGSSIGIMNKDFRKERYKWFKNHNSYKDSVCQKNCLDVCVDYNNRVEYYVKKNAMYSKRIK